MSQSVVTKHLISKIQELDIKPEQLKDLKQGIILKKNEIKQALKDKEIIIPKVSRPITPIIEKAQNTFELTQQINEAIRLQRLKEAEKLKEELRNKLETVQSSIDVLGNLHTVKQKEQIEQQRIVRLKEAREKYFNKEGIQQESKIQEQAAAFAKEQAHIQKQRRQMYKQYVKESQRKLEQELERLEAQKKEEQEKQKQEKLQKLKEKHLELQQRKQERQLQLQRDKEEMKKFKQKKPLFKNLEEKYEQEILMPELEKRKEELKKRREFYGGSVGSNELYEHSKKYESNLQELKMKRERDKKEKELDYKVSIINNNYNSAVLKELLEKERKLREQEIIGKKEKAELIQKRNRYGELVKSMYAPIPSVNKKLELEKLNETNITRPREARLNEIKKEAKD